MGTRTSEVWGGGCPPLWVEGRARVRADPVDIQICWRGEIGTMLRAKLLW